MAGSRLLFISFVLSQFSAVINFSQKSSYPTQVDHLQRFIVNTPDSSTSVNLQCVILSVALSTRLAS